MILGLLSFTLFLSVNVEFVTSGCNVDYISKVAETTSLDVDYLVEGSEYKPIAVEKAQSIFSETEEYIRAFNSDTMQSELATIHPKYSGCAWLTVNHLERAGLGHTFNGWSFYLQVALHLNLTYYSPFYTMAHNLCYTNEVAPFFGFHNAYYWARSPPENATVIDVQKEWLDCEEKHLLKAIQDYENSTGHPLSCDDGHVVFRCYNDGVHFFGRLLNHFDQVIGPVRAAFTPSYKRHSPLHIPTAVRKAKEEESIIITVHIRRGDILWRGVRIDKNRLVSVYCYKTMMKQIFENRNRTIANITNNTASYTSQDEYATALRNAKRPIKIFFLCEGAEDESHVAEYAPWDLHATFPVDVHELLHEFCNPSLDCSALVLYNESNYGGFLEAFSAMCEADILITSPSGYPFTASLFCEPKITVAIKLGMDYSGINNVVVAHPYDPFWMQDSFVELLKFEPAWDNLIQLKLKEPLPPVH